MTTARKDWAWIPGYIPELSVDASFPVRERSPHLLSSLSASSSSSSSALFPFVLSRLTGWPAFSFFLLRGGIWIVLQQFLPYLQLIRPFPVKWRQLRHDAPAVAPEALPAHPPSRRVCPTHEYHCLTLSFSLSTLFSPTVLALEPRSWIRSFHPSMALLLSATRSQPLCFLGCRGDGLFPSSFRCTPSLFLLKPSFLPCC
ncbi:hypothetical protein B296_00034065 [Ensete ventricosum]|uniref:Uncharacterized protein n=1 Tax=Ensete ventricosum TaxID=4639 RepID=A0A426ZFT4_ENSVE|nr:hypothetical protein B296_00034065 [Ensete ventricosum]